MPLVLRHMRPDLGQFPDLMPQRGRIRSGEPRSAPPACCGLERFLLVAVCRRNQGPIVLSMPRLPAPLPLRLPSRRPRRMRVLAARRQGGVLRCPRTLVFGEPPLQLSHLPAQLSNLGHQQPHHRLGVRRPLRNLPFGDLQRHVPYVAGIGCREKATFRRFDAPGCERLPLWVSAVMMEEKNLKQLTGYMQAIYHHLKSKKYGILKIILIQMD